MNILKVNFISMPCYRKHTPVSCTAGLLTSTQNVDLPTQLIYTAFEKKSV